MLSPVSIFQTRTFWIGCGSIALVQWLCLALGTPLYEIDTNSFVRGGFTWDIYHNPLLNIYIAACTKIWPNVWFIVGLQTLFYAVAAAFLAKVLFGDQVRWFAIACVLAALEPVTMFYNHSMLAESFFTSFAMLTVAMLVLWMRHLRWQSALLLGLMMGLCFMAKLSAMIHLPLLGIMLLRQGHPFWGRVRSLGVALVPFTACYAFVFVGQGVINDGDVYTVEGRVRWDFSSALYDSTEAGNPDFARLVHPHVFQDGQYVAHRELRRELSHLGYKDCVREWEARGYPEQHGINACDSLFGAVAEKIMARHFWAAERQFVADNFRFVHSLNYIDDRFTPGLHYYHPQSEYQYIDSLMSVTYDYSLAERESEVPRIWRSLDFGNFYFPVLWWMWWLVLATGTVIWLQHRDRWELLVLGLITAIPIVFHLVYISYRPRFLAPYIVLMLCLLLVEAGMLLRRPGPSPQGERDA